MNLVSEYFGKNELIGVDVETVSGSAYPGDNPSKADKLRWSRNMHPKRGGHIRLIQFYNGHDDPLVLDLYDNDPEIVWQAMNDFPGQFVAHNASFEQLYFRANNVRARVNCTMILDAMLRGKVTPYEDDDSENFQIYRGLDQCAAEYLGLNKAGDEQSSDWSGDLTQDQIDYAAQDAKLPLLLWLHMTSHVRNQQGVRLIMDAIGPTADINLTGLAVNDAAHLGLIKSLEAEAETLRQDIIVPGLIDNPASNPQVSKAIDQLMTDAIGSLWKAQIGWPETATGQLKVSKPVVTHLIPTIDQYLPDLATYLRQRVEWSRSHKLSTSFGQSMRKLRDDDNRYRGQFNVYGAVTGRMSCKLPNLQQMPAKTDGRFRQMFIAKSPSHRLVVADYSQIELRVAGLLSGDPNFERIFREGLDIHTATASFMFDTPDPTPNQRKGAKAVNFGIIYGATAPTLSLSIGCDTDTAQDFLERWLGSYPTFTQWRNDFANTAKQQGYFQTAGGRTILVDREGAFTKLCNYPVQGGSADVLYRAMHLIDEALFAFDAQDIKLAAVIHDEIILECHQDRSQLASRILTDCMAEALTDVFPGAFTGDLVDASVVTTWADKD